MQCSVNLVLSVIYTIFIGTLLMGAQTPDVVVRAALHRHTLQTIIVRLGLCHLDKNEPRALGKAGTETEFPPPTGSPSDVAWLKEQWISDDDL